MITALSPSLSIRTAIISSLTDDVQLTAFGLKVHPGKLPNKPVWPFLIVPTPSGVPTWRDGSGGGSEMTGVVHSFVGVAPATPDPEAAAANINAHIVRILDGLDLVIDEVAISIHPTLDQVIRDGAEADAWHGVVNYAASAT